ARSKDLGGKQRYESPEEGFAVRTEAGVELAPPAAGSRGVHPGQSLTGSVGAWPELPAGGSLALVATSRGSSSGLDRPFGQKEPLSCLRNRPWTPPRPSLRTRRRRRPSPPRRLSNSCAPSAVRSR